MTLNQMLINKIKSIDTNGKNVKVISILVKNREILKDNFNVTLWNHINKENCPIGVGITSTFRGIPVILSPYIEDDVSFEFVLE